jgi:hypothetical protein
VACYLCDFSLLRINRFAACDCAHGFGERAGFDGGESLEILARDKIQRRGNRICSSYRVRAINRKSRFRARAPSCDRPDWSLQSQS